MTETIRSYVVDWQLIFVYAVKGVSDAVIDCVIAYATVPFPIICNNVINTVCN
jgi:hypothetical protein